MRPNKLFFRNGVLKIGLSRTEVQKNGNSRAEGEGNIEAGDDQGSRYTVFMFVLDHAGQEACTTPGLER